MRERASVSECASLSHFSSYHFFTTIIIMNIIIIIIPSNLSQIYRHGHITPYRHSHWKRSFDRGSGGESVRKQRKIFYHLFDTWCRYVRALVLMVMISNYQRNCLIEIFCVPLFVTFIVIL